MAASLRKNLLVSGGSSTSLHGPKFGATLDLLRLLSSNLFKLDAMLKVHEETDIDMKQSLVEALDSVRKVRRPLSAPGASNEAHACAHRSSGAPLCLHVLTSALIIDRIAHRRPDQHPLAVFIASPARR